MTQSAKGWLCLACGHMDASSVEASAPVSAPEPTPESIPEPSLAVDIIHPTEPPVAPFEVAPPPADVPSQAESVPMPPTTSRPSRITGKLIALVLGVLVVIGLVAAAAYLYLIAPKLALGEYLGRLVGAKTTVFSSDISTESTDGYKFSLKLAGKDDITDVSKPKLDIGVTGQLSISGGVIMPGASNQSGSLAGQIRLLSQVAYFKIESFSLLTQLLPIKISNDWYKYDFSSVDTVKKCQAKQKDSGSLLGSAILTKIPVKNASFKGIDTISGSPMMHFVGTVDNSKIKQAIDDANKNLSADCKLDISPDDYKTVSVTYDIWHGWSKDRALINVVESTTKSKSSITFDTGSYNKPVKIDAPTGAKDVADLISGLMGGTADGSSPTGTQTADNSALAGKARDTQRTTDILEIRTGLEEYFVANNYYPKTLAELAVAPVDGMAILKSVPTDPTNKTPNIYTYIPGKIVGGHPTTFAVRACLEDATSTYQYVVKAVPPCTTATFERQNEN